MPFIGKQSTSNSQITNYTTTVGSGGQTNFTVVVEGGDETHVYLNGVLLKETTDYTVSSTQVSLVSAAAENDIVEIKVFRSFALVDAVKASDGGTFSGDVTVPNLTLSSNVIKASDGGSTITLDTSDNVTIAGNLKVKDGGTIGSASDADAITISSSGAVTLSSDFAPATPLSHRNLIVNGAMQIAQRTSALTALANASIQTVDQMRFYHSSDGGISTSQHSMAEAELEDTGFSKAYNVKATTADAGTTAASHYAMFANMIEAQNLQHLQYGTDNAKTITLSFWVKSSVAGTYCVCVKKPDSTSYYFIKEYTIISANTWEKKEITIVPDSNIKATAGAITNDNGAGFEIYFVLAAGANHNSGTNNTWNTASDVWATTNQVNFLGTINNQFYITGLQLELGSVATPFEHRGYAEELVRCQRYFYPIHRLNDGAQYMMTGYFWATGQGLANFQPPTTMRTSPTVVSPNSSNSLAFYVAGSSNNFDYFTLNGATPQNVNLTMQGEGTGTAGYAGGVAAAGNDTYLYLTAEL